MCANCVGQKWSAMCTSFEKGLQIAECALTAAPLYHRSVLASLGFAARPSISVLVVPSALAAPLGKILETQQVVICEMSRFVSQLKA